MSAIEFAEGKRGISPLVSLAEQAGMPLDELMEDMRHGGRNAALRRAAEKADRRNHSGRGRQVAILARRHAPV